MCVQALMFKIYMNTSVCVLQQKNLQIYIILYIKCALRIGDNLLIAFSTLRTSFPYFPNIYTFTLIELCIINMCECINLICHTLDINCIRMI
jgi:hypothetical protein